MRRAQLRSGEEYLHASAPYWRRCWPTTASSRPAPPAGCERVRLLDTEFGPDGKRLPAEVWVPSVSGAGPGSWERHEPGVLPAALRMRWREYVEQLDESLRQRAAEERRTAEAEARVTVVDGAVCVDGEPVARVRIEPTYTARFGAPSRFMERTVNDALERLVDAAVCALAEEARTDGR